MKKKGKKIERKIKELLAGRLKENYPDIYQDILIDVNLGSSKIIREDWRKQWKGLEPRLQPDIDLLYIHHDKKITATEVKYFKRQGNSLNHPFYQGIEQAVALLLFGFDNVSLMHVFSEGVDEDSIRQYGGRAWQFVRKILGSKGIELDFTLVKYFNRTENFQVFPINYRDDTLPVERKEVGDLSPLINWKHPNPFVNDAVTKPFRQLAVRYLEKKGFSGIS